MKRLASLCLLFAAAASGAAAQEDPVCTDRPTKANSVCSVPAGKWQVESDIANYTRNTAGGVRSETTYIVNPYLKYGLTDRIDLQANWAPYIRGKTTGSAADSGSGDLYLRLKGRVVTGDRLQLSLIPFVKAPVASRGFGNDKWEGGLAAPVSTPLGQGFTLTLGPELDVLADADGAGRHLALINLVNIGKAVSETVTLYGEVWSSWNYDPVGTVRQYSADVAVAWLAAPTLQFDLGGAFGLNRNTPDAQVYVGVSKRF